MATSTEKKAASANVSKWAGAASMVTSLGSIHSTYLSGKLDRLIADHNSIMAGYENEMIDLKVNQQVDILREEESRLIGDARSIAGSSGFSVASETNLAVEADIMKGISEDIAVIRINGGFEKLRTNAEAQRSQLEADNSTRAANAKIVTSLSQLPENKGFSSIFKKRDDTK